MDDIDVSDLLENTEYIFEYPMVDRDPLPWWTKGRVTLLGDAAHPMYPVGANGASQAILDGEALSEALSLYEPAQGLSVYEENRLQQTANVILDNRKWGPERVLDIADKRIKRSSDRIEDHLTEDEIALVAKKYRKVADFRKKEDMGET